MYKLIKALYTVLAGDYTLISWEFDSKVYKKVYMLSKQILKENNIESFYPKSEWPHISIGLVKTPSNEEKNKIKLAAPLFKKNYKLLNLEVLKGTEDLNYLTIELKAPEEHKEFFHFLVDLLGDDRVKKPPSYPKFKPHASILTVNKKDTADVQRLLPQIEKVIKSYLVNYTPDHILIWDDFEISEIEFSFL
jgi:hypothetical protein